MCRPTIQKMNGELDDDIRSVQTAEQSTTLYREQGRHDSSQTSRRVMTLFSVAAPSIWNTIPANIRLCHSLSILSDI